MASKTPKAKAAGQGKRRADAKTKAPAKRPTAGANDARYFESPETFRAWLAEHHRQQSELWVGYHKRHTKLPSMTWSESVDEALCFGWIDGVRRSVDEDRYAIRFTPRKAGSAFSLVNQRKMEALKKEGRLTKWGSAALDAAKPQDDRAYSYERRPAKLPKELRALLDEDLAAAKDFDGRPPWYKRAAIWWVISAKREETRARRMASVVLHHAKGEVVPPLRRT